MRLPRSLPLRRKLILISLATAAAALLLGGVLMFGAEVISFRDSIVSDLTIKADIIGSQCSAALLFGVRRDAEETLAALRADERIEYAAVYDKRGALFAEYRRAGAKRPDISPAPAAEGYEFGLNHLSLARPINVRGKAIGSAFILSDLQKLHTLLLRYLVAAAIVLACSLLVAYGLGSRLQRTITRPVTELVDLMQRISREQDFSMRAVREGNDELGALAGGFNEMVTTIQERDIELERHRLRLENTVADLRRSTAELQDANRKLKALDNLKSDVISIVSHELRTPLTSIKAFAELILNKPNMTLEKKAKYLEIINAESDRLARLITDLLDLSRIEAGKMEWRIKEVFLEDVVRESVAGFNPLAAKKGIRISTEIGSSLPVVFGDRDRLVQVMTNLLSNAVKFTPENGSIRVAARIERSPAPTIVVAVSDTGVGIPPEDLKVIFDKFHRSGDILTSPVEGTGLGLSIAREIVEHHGGSIWADSAPGKGSVFTFTLPLDRIADAA